MEMIIMNRTITTVLESIVEILDESNPQEEELIKSLEKISYDATYTAPEVMGMRWNDAYDQLVEYFFQIDNGCTPTYFKTGLEDKATEIFVIFSGNSEKIIRDQCIRK